MRNTKTNTGKINFLTIFILLFILSVTDLSFTAAAFDLEGITFPAMADFMKFFELFPMLSLPGIEEPGAAAEGAGIIQSVEDGIPDEFGFVGDLFQGFHQFPICFKRYSTHAPTFRLRLDGIKPGPLGFLTSVTYKVCSFVTHPFPRFLSAKAVPIHIYRYIFADTYLPIHIYNLKNTSPLFLREISFLSANKVIQSNTFVK